jgi:hypothetical protein
MAHPSIHQSIYQPINELYSPTQTHNLHPSISEHVDAVLLDTIKVILFYNEGRLPSTTHWQ